jgi:hypothetical protein
MEQMRSKRNRAKAKRASLFRPHAMLRWIFQHVERHSWLYAPACAPVLFLLLAHMVSLPALVLTRVGGTEGVGAASRTLLTWAVFGFLPFLVLSYLAFFLVARPFATLLARRQFALPARTSDLLPAVGYGATIAMGMFSLLRPGNWPGDLALLLCCLAAGGLNWFLYRWLVGPGPVSVD